MKLFFLCSLALLSGSYSLAEAQSESLRLANLQQNAPVIRRLPETVQRAEPQGEEETTQSDESPSTIRPIIQRPIRVLPNTALTRTQADPGWIEGAQDGRIGQVAFTLPGTSSPVQIRYEAIDGLAIAEGDIILGRIEDIEARNRQRPCSGELCTVSSPLLATNNASYLWPGGVIFYEPPAEMPAEMWDRFERGLAHITSATDLRFVERTNQRDYVAVNYTEDRVCNATIGRRGGRQGMNISLACWPNEIAHEFLHAAGIWHEHSRADRDEYVEIIWENIQPGEEHNFRNRSDEARAIGEYDYQSIMHYARGTFGIEDENGRRLPTLRILRPDLPQRNADGLSAGDIRGIRELYGTQDCIRIRPGTARAQRMSGRGGWTLVAETISGNANLHAFRGQGENEEAAARRAADIFNAHTIDQYCYIERRPRSTYLLSGSVMPSGAIPGEDCVPFNPATLEVDQHSAGWRVLAQGRGGSRISLAVYDEVGLAYRLADTLQQFNATRQCFANRGSNALIYWRN